MKKVAPQVSYGGNCEMENVSLRISSKFTEVGVDSFISLKGNEFNVEDKERSEMLEVSDDAEFEILFEDDLCQPHLL